jgi:cephalosporin hydroxylase
MVLFQDSNRYKKLPEKTEICCFWCCHNFASHPVAIPSHIVDDTWHVYGQLKRELEKFSPITQKYIIMHDTTVDGIYGETIRCRWNAVAQSKQSGIPIEEINCGLWKAVEEFLENNPEWKLRERFMNNNGLTVLERVV